MEIEIKSRQLFFQRKKRYWAVLWTNGHQKMFKSPKYTNILHLDSKINILKGEAWGARILNRGFYNE